jgi:hypothetical protein
MGVLEIGHVGASAGVQRVDDHLPVHRAGDLDPSIFEVVGRRRDFPDALANCSGLLRELR